MYNLLNMQELKKALKSVLKYWKIILGSTIFMTVLMLLLTKNISKEYESSATIFTGFATGEGIVQQGAYDNVSVIITSRETLKEVGLRLFAMNLTLKETHSSIYNEQINNFLNKVPYDIRQLVGKTDSITYHNLNEIADTNPFLVGLVNYLSPYYSITALSTIKVYRMSNSDMIGLTYSCNDPNMCQKTLEILIHVCIRNSQRIMERSFSNIEVIDMPNYPLKAKSKRKNLVILGMIIGFIIPSSIFYGMARFNINIQTPKRAEELTGLSLAGIMPNTKDLQTLKNYEIISDGLNDTILKNLYLTNHKSNQMRVLIISTRPGEGKTIISNLLCERLLNKRRKCLVVQPFIDSGSWSVISYKIDKSFYQTHTEDVIPIEKMNDAEILIIELPSLIMNDYPVELIRQFDMAFLICKANRKWVKADQTALDTFIKISDIKPQIILNDVELDLVEEFLGKIV